MFYDISTEGLNPNDLVRVVSNPNTGQSQEKWVPVSAFSPPLNTPVIDLTAQPAPALASGLVSYWPLDEMSGMRYDEYGRGGVYNDFQEYNITGVASVVLSTAGRQDRGLAADFSGNPFGGEAWRLLGTQLPEMTSDLVAINFHCKLALPAAGTGCPIVCLSPRQFPRRAEQPRPGNFLCVGLEKVAADSYRFTAYAGYLFEGGHVWLDKVLSDVEVSANTYYQVLVDTSFVTDASGAISTRYLNISVNNNLDSVPRTVNFNVDAPWLSVGDNPVLAAHQDRPMSLAVDNLAVWYGRLFTPGQREQLYNGGRGFDLTSTIYQKCKAFWELDEVTGTRADTHDGHYMLSEPVTAVGSAAGQVGLAANFEGDDGIYLATQNLAVPSAGLSLAGLVRFDVVGASAPKQALIGWLSESDVPNRHRGFRLYYELDSGIVLQVGDGSSTMKNVSQDVVGGILANTWYFVCCGIGADGELFISIDDAARTIGGTRSFPAQHWKLFMLGRDYGGVNNIEPLDGRMDCWGLYSPVLTIDEQGQIFANPSYPF